MVGAHDSATTKSRPPPSALLKKAYKIKRPDHSQWGPYVCTIDKMTKSRGPCLPTWFIYKIKYLPFGILLRAGALIL